MSSIQAFILLVPSLILLQELPIASYNFLSNMHRWHNYTYKKHACRHLMITLNFVVLCLFIISGCFYECFFSNCAVSQLKMFNDFKDYNQSGFCHDIIQNYMHQDLNVAALYYSASLTFVDFTFIFFLVVKKPHDCFKCLNKNPNVFYSTHQIYQHRSSTKRLSDQIHKPTELLLDFDQDTAIPAHAYIQNDRFLKEMGGSVDSLSKFSEE